MVRAPSLDRVHVGADDAGVEQVTNDCNRFPLDVSKMLPHGYCVEKRLSGVLVRTVTGVDDGGTHPIRGDPTGEQVRGTGARVTDDERLHADGGEGEPSIAK